ncbi:hypothetical protein [Mucilaginibacter sp.]|uniref:hypothetical protein n=1 Tax=Mucilaginibacter sp. TaxID=1882438 RepID=UPI00262596A6|nr:hypothetical protein [Mucilaginibacter sp.]MDB4927102.1 hypothetical protein [Mucilaginibacter sp.]
MPASNTFKRNTLRNILWLGLLTGTLDAVAALLLNYKISPLLIFRFIASGVFGKAAFAGAEEMVVAGVLFHYLIAYVFSAAFYLLYPFSYSIFKNKYVVAIVYGGIAWVIMNLIVIPLSQIGPHYIKPMAIITGVCALIICVALPVALIADKKLSKRA